MSEGFTKGPWWASATREVFNPARRTVCRAHLDGNRCSREEALANAHLIAAAPELYEALQVATYLLDRYHKETPLGHQPHMIAISAEAAVNVGTAALAKSRGERP